MRLYDMDTSDAMRLLAERITVWHGIEVIVSDKSAIPSVQETIDAMLSSQSHAQSFTRGSRLYAQGRYSKETLAQLRGYIESCPDITLRIFVGVESEFNGPYWIKNIKE